ncbi:BnaC02g42010D [Brassica napus]|uniref:BnaC02g42010D protein n=1 Tax=Brassica napus TaxID=3708 RepID=A0A078IB20_BRANA|nr:BnaC02g42010D [Brassica napus]
MAALVLSLLLLAMAGHSSAAWCVCKTGLSDDVLQKTIDYACGNGADCNPTHPKAPCFNPDNVRSHCNYAVNSFFQKKRQASGTCDFSGTATPTNSDPSYSGCTFPTSASGSGGSTTGTTNPKGNSTSTTLPGGNSPYSGTSTNGVFGNNSTGATGTGVNPDYTTESSAFALKNSRKLLTFLVLIASIDQRGKFGVREKSHKQEVRLCSSSERERDEHKICFLHPKKTIIFSSLFLLSSQDNGSGSETGSETALPPSSSSSTEKSVTSYKKKNTKPCKICGSNEDDDDVIKCHEPSWWLCEVCRTLPGVVEVKPEDSNETANSVLPNDSVSSSSSRVDAQNSAYNSSSTASINTSPEKKRADSNAPSDSESSK